MLNTNLSATRIEGGWAYYDCNGLQVAIRFDWTPLDDWSRYATDVRFVVTQT